MPQRVKDNLRLELVTDNVTKEIARIVVEGDDGKLAIFFVTVTFNKRGVPTCEVVGKRKNGESTGQAVADWQDNIPGA
jgi:hypothetical protein